MEGAQDAQAVLGGKQPEFQLSLVRALPDDLSAADWLGCGSQLLGLLALGLLSQWVPKWALIAFALVGLLVAHLLGWLKLPVAPRQQVGRLLIFPDRVVVEVAKQARQYPLNATTRIRVRYQGYQGESLGGRQFASGIHNFIQLNDASEYAFDMPSAMTEARLRTALRSWYLRKVQLKEYRRNNRTVLLTPNLSDEQVQQYQREFNIKLYG